MTALNTTKRKFAKLLENLTAPTPSSPLQPADAIPSSATEPPPKRSRLSDVEIDSSSTPRKGSFLTAVGASRFAARSSFDNNSPSSLRLVKGTGSGKNRQISPATARKTPNYAPYSLEQFLTRLRTFADVKLWTSKPDALSEVVWAKRGWILESWNKVACKRGCESRLSIRLRAKRRDDEGKEMEDTEDELLEVDEGLVEKYSELIADAHAEGCLWRRAGCKADIYHIPLARRENCERGVLERYDTLLPIASFLPPIDSLSVPGDPPETFLDLLPTSLFKLSQAPNSGQPMPTVSAATSTLNLTALSLSLFGWTGTLQSTLALLFCPQCFQRIGLWMYTPDRLEQMSATLDVPVSHLRLKLAEAHREHCPWRNAESQHNPPDGPLKDLNAWETVLNTLKRTSQWRQETTSRPQIPAPRIPGIKDGQLGEGEDVSTAEVQMTPAELEKQDRERTTKWRKLRARMSFRRPKSSGSEKAASLAPSSMGKSSAAEGQ